MAYLAPVTRATGTLITAAIWNQDIVDNVAHLASFKHGGVALSAYNPGGQELGWYVGDYKYRAGNELVLGSQAWLLCDGRTLGSAASGATVANANMATLFTHLWTNFANAQLPILDSLGVASTRGASAAADFAANKRLPIPDFRGRLPVGMDNNGSGTGSANRITAAWADSMGGTGGAETHQLLVAEMPSHNHALTGMTGLSGLTAGPYGFAAGATQLEGLIPQGGGGAHNNLQPSIAAGNWYIYAGN